MTEKRSFLSFLLADMAQISLETMKKTLRHRGYTDIHPVQKCSIRNYVLWKITGTYNVRFAPAPTSFTCIWVLDEKKEVVPVPKSLLGLLMNDGHLDCSHIILITSSISSHALAALAQYTAHYEIFSFQETLSFIGHHMYVPRYTILKEQDVVSYEQTYGSRHNFPKIIARVDPMARLMNLRPGDTVRVHRASRTSGTSFFLRYVVEDNR